MVFQVPSPRNMCFTDSNNLEITKHTQFRLLPRRNKLWKSDENASRKRMNRTFHHFLWRCFVKNLQNRNFGFSKIGTNYPKERYWAYINVYQTNWTIFEKVLFLSNLLNSDLWRWEMVF